MSTQTRHVPSIERLEQFLKKCRVAKGADFTHTSLGRPMGSYYIPFEDSDEFMSLYKNALEAGCNLHFTEKHRHMGPVIIDLDFRFETHENFQRRYTSEHIRHIVEHYLNHLHEFLELPSTTEVYVLEKEAPTLQKDVIKDGIHIIIPDVVTRPSIQYMVRNRIVQGLKTLFKDVIGSINSVEDIVDVAIIEKNNWMMYGSKKPEQNAYVITKILSCDVGTGEFVEKPIDKSHSEYVEILSIRNKYTESKIKSDKLEEVRAYDEKLQAEKQMAMRGHVNKCILMERENTKQNESENLDQIKYLVAILNESRADNYNDWIRVGWCLRNLDHRLLDTWVEFSKKSKKYKEGECQKFWRYMRDEGLGIGTLHMWAKQDSPEAYLDIVRNELKDLIMQSLSGTHHDVARVIHHLYRHQYVCACIRSNIWYEFRNHRWHAIDGGYSLRMKISNDVWKEYMKLSLFYNTQALQSDLSVDQQRNQEYSTKLSLLSKKLKEGPFKENVMKECRDLFHVEGFIEKLDSHVHLIGFENGVYDLDLQEFREGRPDDFVSFSTRNDYIPYDADHPKIHQIQKYLAQVLTRPQVREYVLKLFASFLHGTIKEQKFHIWTGSGSNSKSKLVELYEKAFGDYCCTFPVSLLTQKRVASNAATPEIARAKGKRCASLQEPTEDEKLNIGLMKELVSGDRIVARPMYQTPIEFIPQFKMLLLCNHLPSVPSDDGGTWRRIRVVEFTSKFVENPREENEFPIDYELSEKLDSWREHFMSLLINYYSRYVQEGIHEPDEVLQCTREYKNQNDHMANFLGEKVEKHGDAFLDLTEIFNEFKAWVKDNNIPVSKLPTKTDLEKSLSKHLNSKVIAYGNSKGYRGFRIKQMHAVEQDNDDIDG